MSSVSTSGSGAPKSSFSFGRVGISTARAGGVCGALYRLCHFCPDFTFINMKGLGLAISMWDGGVWHVVLPCFR